MAMAALLLGCQRHSPGHSPSLSAPAGAAAQPSASLRSVEPEGLALVPAARCGECHGRIESEWRRSAHAKAAASPIYQRMRAVADASSCDACHSPLRRYAPADPVASEGVSCDGCHTLASAGSPGSGAATAVFAPADNLRYGPLCDTQPHYFHRMGCSPWLRESSFCATCHDGPRHLPGATAAARSLFPEYEEWRDEYSALGSQDCQVCHMPASRAEVAVGSGERSGIREHGFAVRERLLSRALSGQARVGRDSKGLHIVITLSNHGAGHAVPSGLPERRLQVGVELLDARGQVIARDEHSRGRVLVDAAGQEAPFFAASRVERDTRIHPGKSESEDFFLPLAGASKLQIFVRRRPLPIALWQRLGGSPLADEPMLQAELELSGLSTTTEPLLLRLQP